MGFSVRILVLRAAQVYPGSAEGPGKKAGDSAEGGDGGVGCGGYFPGDGLADDGKRKDADDAEGAKNGHDVRKRDTFGPGNVGDGDVEGHGDRKERSDQGDEKDAADGGWRDERLGRKKFDDERT